METHQRAVNNFQGWSDTLVDAMATLPMCDRGNGRSQAGKKASSSTDSFGGDDRKYEDRKMKKENRELLDLFEEHVMNSITFAHAQPVVIMPQALKLFIDILNEQDQRITGIENLMVNQTLTNLEEKIALVKKGKTPEEQELFDALMM